MASLRQHYESIKGNKSFILGGLGLVLGFSSPVGTIAYMSANDMGRWSPEPSGRYARVIEIEDELSRNLSVGEVDSHLVDKVGVLKAELDTLNSNPEVMAERQESEGKEETARKLIPYAIAPMAFAFISGIPFLHGNIRRKERLRELIGK